MDKKRVYYGNLSGAVGLVCNFVLFGAKLAVGLLFGAMAVVADAFNNLSDMGSNVVSLIGFKVAARPADKEHPYGHARAEYIAAMIVAFIIFLLSAELIKSAVQKIVSPTPTEFSYIAVGVLAFAMAVKLFMFLFNKKLGKKVGSLIIEATAVDSISDVAATGAVLVAMLLGKFTGIDLDAYMTIAVALFIILAGIKVVRAALTKLLGEGATKELSKEITSKIMAYEGVLGIHDLQVHNYGPAKVFASAHVEVDAKKPILESHDLIDRIEKDLDDLNLVIHLDPIVTDDPLVNKMRLKAVEFAGEIDPSFELHDFRMVIGTTHTNIIFDLVVPFECDKQHKKIIETLDAKFKGLDKNYYTVIKIDRS